jgi:putative aldouronate transport system permease protein
VQIKSSMGERLFDVAVYIVLCVLIIVTIYPLLHVAFASFSDSDRIISHQGLLLKPLGFTLEAYKLVFANSAILTGYGNTLFIVIVGVIFNLFLTALGAFVLSRKNVLVI